MIAVLCLIFLQYNASLCSAEKTIANLIHRYQDAVATLEEQIQAITVRLTPYYKRTLNRPIIRITPTTTEADQAYTAYLTLWTTVTEQFVLNALQEGLLVGSAVSICSYLYNRSLYKKQVNTGGQKALLAIAALVGTLYKQPEYQQIPAYTSVLERTSYGSIVATASFMLVRLASSYISYRATEYLIELLNRAWEHTTNQQSKLHKRITH